MVDQSREKSSFTVLPKQADNLRASSVEGMNLPFSMAYMVWRDTPTMSASSCCDIRFMALSTLMLFFMVAPPSVNCNVCLEDNDVDEEHHEYRGHQVQCIVCHHCAGISHVRSSVETVGNLKDKPQDGNGKCGAGGNGEGFPAQVFREFVFGFFFRECNGQQGQSSEDHIGYDTAPHGCIAYPSKEKNEEQCHDNET